MSFVAHTQEELQDLDIKEDEIYTIKYINRDYFNAEDNLELGIAKAVLDDTGFMFIVTDPYGMDKFIKEVRVIK